MCPGWAWRLHQAQVDHTNRPGSEWRACSHPQTATPELKVGPDPAVKNRLGQRPAGPEATAVTLAVCTQRCHTLASRPVLPFDSTGTSRAVGLRTEPFEVKTLQVFSASCLTFAPRSPGRRQRRAAGVPATSRPPPGFPPAQDALVVASNFNASQPVSLWHPEGTQFTPCTWPTSPPPVVVPRLHCHNTSRGTTSRQPELGAKSGRNGSSAHPWKTEIRIGPVVKSAHLQAKPPGPKPSCCGRRREVPAHTAVVETGGRRGPLWPTKAGKHDRNDCTLSCKGGEAWGPAGVGAGRLKAMVLGWPSPEGRQILRGRCCQALFEEGPPAIHSQTGLPWKCVAPPPGPPHGWWSEQLLQTTGPKTDALHSEVRWKRYGHANHANPRNQIIEQDVTLGMGTPSRHDNVPQAERLRKGAGECPRMFEQWEAGGSCRVDVANARERHHRTPSEWPRNRGGRSSGHKRPRCQRWC